MSTEMASATEPVRYTVWREFRQACLVTLVECPHCRVVTDPRTAIHCRSCCETFAGVAAARRHERWGQCFDPAAVPWLVLDGQGRWTVPYGYAVPEGLLPAAQVRGAQSSIRRVWAGEGALPEPVPPAAGWGGGNAQWQQYADLREGPAAFEADEQGTRGRWPEEGPVSEGADLMALEDLEAADEGYGPAVRPLGEDYDSANPSERDDDAAAVLDRLLAA